MNHKTLEEGDLFYVLWDNPNDEFIASFYVVINKENNKIRAFRVLTEEYGTWYYGYAVPLIDEEGNALIYEDLEAFEFEYDTDEFGYEYIILKNGNKAYSWDGYPPYWIGISLKKDQ